MSRVLQSSTNRVTQSFKQHMGWAKGVDIVRHPCNVSPIIAHSDGVVIKVISYIPKNSHSLDHEGMGYGNYVMIKHSGDYVTLYAHLDEVYVRVGQEVKQGDVIAFMGNTGNSFGAHLHFEVRAYSKFTNSLHDTNTFKWLDSEQYIDSDIVTIPVVEPVKDEIYRVRKVWEDGEKKGNQLGAYKILQNAINKAKANEGYSVFDSNGNKVYGG